MSHPSQDPAETAHAERSMITAAILLGDFVQPVRSAHLTMISSQIREANERVAALNAQLSKVYDSETTDAQERLCIASAEDDLRKRSLAVRRKDVSPEFFVPEDIVAQASRDEQPRLLRSPFFTPLSLSQLSSKTAQMFDGDSLEQNVTTALCSRLLQTGANLDLLTPDLSGPEDVVQTRAYAASMLREPLPRTLERPCLQGEKCIGNTTLNNILVEYLSPEERTEVARTGKQVPVHRMCLRCIRKVAANFNQCAKHLGLAQGSRPDIIRFHNITDRPGEYSLKECIWIVGVMGPLVMEITRNYTRMKNEREGIFYHIETHYIKPQPPDFYMGPQRN